MLSERGVIEQINMLEEQHRLVLRQWQGELSAVIRFRLNLQMIALEDDVASYERHITDTKTPSVQPEPVKLSAYQTVDLIIKVEKLNDEFHLKLQLDQTVSDPISIPKEQVKSWLSGSSDPQYVGAQLDQTVFGSSNHNILNQWIEQGQQLGIPLRMRLQARCSNLLLTLPWEWFSIDQTLISEQYGILYVREQTDKDVPPYPSLNQQSDFRILFTSSQVDIKQETKSLQSLAEHFPSHIQLSQLHNRTPIRLAKYVKNAKLQNAPFHIWHHHGKVSISRDQLVFDMGGKTLSSNDILKLMIENVELNLLVLHTTGAFDDSMYKMRQILSEWEIPAVLHIHSTQAFPMDYFRVLYMTSTTRPIDEAFAWAMQSIDPNFFTQDGSSSPYFLLNQPISHDTLRS